MDFSLKHLAVTTLLLSSLASITTPAFANISAQQGAAIVKTFSNTSVTDFRQFLADVAKSDLGKPPTSARPSARSKATQPFRLNSRMKSIACWASMPE